MKTASALTASALLAIALTGCGTTAEAATTTDGTTITTAAAIKTTAAKPRSAKQWNGIFTKRHPAGTWAGGDVNVSATTNTGDIWWFYGDSFTEPRRAWLEWTESSALMFPKGNSKGRTVTYINQEGQTVPTLLAVGAAEKHWPSAAVNNPKAGNRVILSASNISITGGDMWGFKMIGSTLYDLKLDGGTNPTATIINTVTTPQPTTGSAIQWGSALATDSRNLYIYGSQEVEGQFGKDIYLATAPINTWNNTNTWRYQTATGQTSNINEAQPIFPAADGMPHTFSVTPHPTGDGWLLVAKQNEGIGENVIASAAPQPQGPWTPPQPLFNAAPKNDIWQYMAIAHPNVPTTKGRLLISTSQNVIATDGLARIYRNPKLYRPKFYSVPVNKLPTAK